MSRGWRVIVNHAHYLPTHRQRELYNQRRAPLPPLHRLCGYEPNPARLLATVYFPLPASNMVPEVTELDVLTMMD